MEKVILINKKYVLTDFGISIHKKYNDLRVFTFEKGSDNVVEFTYTNSVKFLHQQPIKLSALIKQEFYKKNLATLTAFTQDKLPAIWGFAYYDNNN